MDGNDGLYPVANTVQDDLRADIVFVHGLGGSAHNSWRFGQEGYPDHFFWPEELGKDLPECGIWTVGYPAGFTRLGLPGMIIAKRAGNLAQKLANAGLGHRPLFFICHSMGGLVVKALLTESLLNPDEDRQRLASMARGIVFCATPHRGSAFADAAGLLGQFFLGTQPHLDEMRANAEPLDLLHDRFVEWQRQTGTPVESYAENVGLFRTGLLGRMVGLGRVVERAAANTGIAGFSVKDVDADHLTIVKPSGRSHDVYAGTLRFIRKQLPAERRIEAEETHSERAVELLTVHFSQRSEYPSLAFSIVNNGVQPVQITSLRAVVAAKIADDHGLMKNLTGVRTALHLDISEVQEGKGAELLGDRYVTLSPGEMEAFSLNLKVQNLIVLLDFDIDYIRPGFGASETISPSQLVLVHASPDHPHAPGAFRLIERSAGLGLLDGSGTFRPWEEDAYADCGSWYHAIARGAGCFILNDPKDGWRKLSMIMKRGPSEGPILTSIAEAALRRSFPPETIQALRETVTNPGSVARLGLSDEESYGISIQKALRRLGS